MTTRPLVFLDTETTGLHADRRPWEIAWIRREPDGTETERLIQISDVDLSTAELKGLQVGRFYERYFRYIGGDQKPDNVEIDREFLAAIAVEEATRDAIVVGAVPSFDTEVLAAMLRRHKLCPSWYYSLVDVENMAAGWLSALPARAPIVARLHAARRELSEQTILTEKIRAYTRSEGLLEAEEKRVECHCVLTEIEKELAGLLSADCRSDDLSRACGVEPPAPEERHTALGDARWVKRWYDHITGAAA